MASEERLRAPLAPGHPSVAAEVAYAVKAEMAVRLSDVVIRRLGLGAAGHPGPAVLQGAAAVAAAELRWTESSTRSEIAEVDRFYEIKS
jgi:glycerol-3-phosphate dehydrogenase